MIVLLGLVGVVLFAGWRIAKRRRAVVLAGLSGEKPTFAVVPPSRSVGSRKTEAL